MPYVVSATAKEKCDEVLSRAFSFIGEFGDVNSLNFLLTNFLSKMKAEKYGIGYRSYFDAIIKLAIKTKNENILRTILQNASEETGEAILGNKQILKLKDKRILQDIVEGNIRTRTSISNPKLVLEELEDVQRNNFIDDAFGIALFARNVTHPYEWYDKKKMERECKSDYEILMDNRQSDSFNYVRTANLMGAFCSTADDANKFNSDSVRKMPREYRDRDSIHGGNAFAKIFIRGGLVWKS